MSNQKTVIDGKEVEVAEVATVTEVKKDGVVTKGVSFAKKHGKKVLAVAVLGAVGVASYVFGKKQGFLESERAAVAHYSDANDEESEETEENNI